MTPEERRTRRRWLVLGALPLWLPVFGLGLVLTVDDLNARASRAQYESGDYGGAVAGFRVLERLDVVERWKAPFGLGTSRFMDGDRWGALAALDRALAVVPQEHRCTVQINRAVVLETWADEEMAQSAARRAEADALELAVERDPGAAAVAGTTPEALRTQARDLAAWAGADYAMATEARQDPACAEQDEEAQDRNQQSQQRLEDKQGAAEEQARPEEGQEEPASPEEQEAERQRELAERNARAEAEAEALRRQLEGGGGGTGNW